MSGPALGWYLRRLRRMSPVEVAQRVQDEGLRRAWGRRQVRPGDTPPLPAGVVAARAFTSGLPADARSAVPEDARAAVVAAADRILAGTWQVLGAVRADSADPDWFLDPLSGRRAPAETFAFAVHHRDENETGNVKQVWEMSRHHHLTVLAAGWWLTGQERYAMVVADQLRSWWRANPFLSGVHWTSGIEVGVRLTSWVWIRRLLDDWPKVGDLFEHDDDAVRQLAWHQEYLAAFVSRGSSANNHVLAEAAGQLAAACAFPWYAQSSRWRRDAARLLQRELAANTFPSGLNRELATDYHRFALEVGLVAAVEAAVQGHRLPGGVQQVLAGMLDAGAAILDAAGRPPRQGDGDEGRGLVVDDPDRDPWAVALGSAGAVLGRPRWATPPPASVQSALLGALTGGRELGRGLRRPAERARRFTDAGLVLLRSRPQDGAEIWCRCDEGPHGFLSIAAHAHADALSLEVRHDGVEILVDPGTYCYHGEPEWRQYFRSTVAHNTLELGGVDQAESGGPFLWTGHPRTLSAGGATGDLPVQTWSAEHDGYTRLAVDAVHRRSVTLDSPGRRLSIEDRVDVADSLPLRLAWHLGPEVTLEQDGATAGLSWTVDGAVRRGRLLLPDGLVWTAHWGEISPVMGWYSPGFARKVASTSLIGSGTTSAGTVLRTVLELPSP